MKKELSSYPPSLNDGSLDFGKGIIGPSRADRKHVDPSIKQIESELIQKGFLPVSQDSRLWKALAPAFRLGGGRILPIAAALSLITTACADKSGEIKTLEAESSHSSLVNPEKSEIYKRVLPISGTSYFTQGAHAWDVTQMR